MKIEYIGPQTLLAMSLFAEYLMTKGVLVSELTVLPDDIAVNLRKEACQFAARKLEQICYGRPYLGYDKMKISLN